MEGKAGVERSLVKNAAIQLAAGGSAGGHRQALRL